MRNDYDIFEKFPDGSLRWRICVSGRYEAQRQLQELAERTENELFAVDVVAGDLMPMILSRDIAFRKQTKSAAKRIA